MAGQPPSAWAYRREVMQPKVALILIGVSFVGGICGGLLLLATSNAAFSKLIPWLLLVATALFAFSGQVQRIVGWIKGKSAPCAIERAGSIGGAAFQLVVAIYGGFFGAGPGILTLAALSIQGFKDMQELNALKNLASAVNYTVAAATFIIAGAVSWPHTLTMLVTAMLGGYAGAAFARRLPAVWLRRPSSPWAAPNRDLFLQDPRFNLHQLKWSNHGPEPSRRRADHCPIKPEYESILTHDALAFVAAAAPRLRAPVARNC